VTGPPAPRQPADELLVQSERLRDEVAAAASALREYVTRVRDLIGSDPEERGGR
jgi:hypothetical protein